MTGVTVIPAVTPIGVRALFTTRVGGVSSGAWGSLNLGVTSGDPPENVAENRRRLCSAVGLDGDRIVLGNQVHEAGVRRVDRDGTSSRFGAASLGWPAGDGLVTDDLDVGLMVLGADCLPVLLWQRDGDTVGAVHAGWRGLVAGILANAVAVMGDPAGIGVAIGPGVGPCCYPVSPEVREVFRDRFGSVAVRGEAVDLAGAAELALSEAGVPADAVVRYGGCTSCDVTRFFSYRRDGAATGRHAGLIWRTTT